MDAHRLVMYVRVCAYVCVRTCVCIDSHRSIHTCVCLRVCAYIVIGRFATYSECLCVCICVCVCVYMFVRMSGEKCVHSVCAPGTLE